MTWTDAAKSGTEFAWGENWRTPNAAEITEEVKNQRKEFYMEDLRMTGIKKQPQRVRLL